MPSAGIIEYARHSSALQTRGKPCQDPLFGRAKQWTSLDVRWWPISDMAVHRSSVELAPKNICYRRIGHIGREAATKAAILRSVGVTHFDVHAIAIGFARRNLVN
jgi:hypothetical protein